MTKTIQKNEVYVLPQKESSMIPIIEKIMSIESFDMDKLEKLIALKIEDDQRYSEQMFYHSLSIFQSQIPAIIKSKQVHYQTQKGVTSYKFAGLDDIAETIKPYLSKNGLTYTFTQDQKDQAIKVTCTVHHASGHSHSCSMQSFSDKTGSKNDIQSIASAITYLRRYTLTGALGIVTADEDIDGRIISEDDQDDSSIADPAIHYYSDDVFEKNLPKWKELILKPKEGKSAKTPEEIISTIESKAPMTEKQKLKLKSIK